MFLSSNSVKAPKRGDDEGAIRKVIGTDEVKAKVFQPKMNIPPRRKSEFWDKGIQTADLRDIDRRKRDAAIKAEIKDAAKAANVSTPAGKIRQAQPVKGSTPAAPAKPKRGRPKKNPD